MAISVPHKSIHLASDQDILMVPGTLLWHGMYYLPDGRVQKVSSRQHYYPGTEDDEEEGLFAISKFRNEVSYSFPIGVYE